METEETKLTKYINELSLTHKKFTDMGEDIMRANNGTKYLIDFCSN